MTDIRRASPIVAFAVVAFILWILGFYQVIPVIAVVTIAYVIFRRIRR